MPFFGRFVRGLISVDVACLKNDILEYKPYVQSDFTCNLGLTIYFLQKAFTYVEQQGIDDRASRKLEPLSYSNFCLPSVAMHPEIKHSDWLKIDMGLGTANQSA